MEFTFIHLERTVPGLCLRFYSYLLDWPIQADIVREYEISTFGL